MHLHFIIFFQYWLTVSYKLFVLYRKNIPHTPSDSFVLMMLECTVNEWISTVLEVDYYMSIVGRRKFLKKSR